MEKQDIYEFAKGDENLIKFLGVDEETDSIAVEVCYDTFEYEDTWVPYGDTHVKSCSAGVDIDVYAIMAEVNGQKTNIKNLLSPRTIEFYESTISEEIKQ